MIAVLITIGIIIAIGVILYKFCDCYEDDDIVPYYCDSDEENIIGKI